MMCKTLYSRIILIYLAVTFGVLAFLGVALGAIFRSQLFSEQASLLLREGTELSSLVSQYLQDGEINEAEQEELQHFVRSMDAMIQIRFNGSDELLVLMDTDKAAKWANHGYADTNSLFAELLSGSKSPDITQKLYKKVLDIPVMTYYSTLSGDGSSYGAMLVSADITNTQAAVSSMNLKILIAAILAFIGAAFVISRTAGHITEPISEMNGIVRKFSKGEYSMRIKTRGSDEISQIGKNFNRMADTLTTLEDSRRMFVANVSHELRSPLTSMRGFLEAILDGTIEVEEREHYLNIVVSENKRMTDMVNDLLDLSRIESGQNVINLEPFDINDLIVRSLLTFEARILAKKIDVDVSFAQDRSFVLADQGQITQVIRNLVDNAIKFTPESGMLRLTTALGKRLIAVSVQDSGEGIAREDIPYVFDRFYKGEKAHTPSGTASTGLGLSIVKKILDQHGQSIRVDSSLGKGTCFTFTLKRTAEPVPKKKAQT